MGFVRSFSHGGITYFIRNPDLSTFFQDLQIARPTTLILIPRISNMLYETYLLKLSEIPKVKSIYHIWCKDLQKMISTVVGVM